MKFPLFPVGQLVATPHALDRLAEAGKDAREYLDRHFRGDWGDCSLDDKQANDRALAEEARIFSSYLLPNGKKIWIITEADRLVTTVLCPEDY